MSRPEQPERTIEAVGFTMFMKALRENLESTGMPSCVSVNERKVLKQIARSLSGNPVIVDLGSGCGSTALAMAEGNPSAQIHCYDWFRPEHPFAAPRLSDAYLLDFQADSPRLSIHKGDLCQKKWNRGPIDLIHVDVCKDIRLFDHVQKEFLPQLRTGSYLIHQDFSQARLPWIHWWCGCRANCLKPLMRIHSSVVYRVTKRPGPCHPRTISQKKAKARHGIACAAKAYAHRADHFSALPELVDIYIDYIFGNKAKARQRMSLGRLKFQKHYRNMVLEIEQ